MQYARFDATGIVRECPLLLAGELASYPTDFSSHVALVPDGLAVTEGWSFDGKDFSPPPPLGVPALSAYAEMKQTHIAEGGITVNVGTASSPVIADVATSVSGRGLVSGAVQLIGLASQANQPAPTFPWVNNDGSKLTLTGAQMITIGYALGAYIQATYATLGNILAEIASGAVSTFAEIDAANWPAAAS